MGCRQKEVPWKVIEKEGTVRGTTDRQSRDTALRPVSRTIVCAHTREFVYKSQRLLNCLVD